MRKKSFSQVDYTDKEDVESLLYTMYITYDFHNDEFTSRFRTTSGTFGTNVKFKQYRLCRCTINKTS